MFDHVVLVVVDALRADRLGTSNPVPRTPELDALASEYAEFENAFACSNVTDVSVTTIMSGEYPLEHGVLHHGTEVSDREKRSAAGTTLLAERLGDAGYETVAIEPVLERWHRRGFDRYLPERDPADDEDHDDRNGMMRRLGSLGGDVLNVLPDSISEPIRHRALGAIEDEFDAEAVTKTALDHFDESDADNTFCFLHYWDTHTPYDPPQSYVDRVRDYGDYDQTPLADLVERHALSGSITEETLYKRKIRGETPETVADTTARYDASVEYADEWIGRLIDGLKQRGIFDDTLVIVTSDHGESLTEHGILYDHHGLYDESIHVPLLLGGGDVPSKTVPGLVQHFDLAPTILDAVGVEDVALTGGSLLPVLDDHATTHGPPYDHVFAEERHTQEKRAMRTDQHKLITTVGDAHCRYCDTVHADCSQLFDLTADPAESTDICERHSDIETALVDAFERWSEGLRTPREADQGTYAEAALEERLEDLGYR